MDQADRDDEVDRIVEQPMRRARFPEVSPGDRRFGAIGVGPLQLAVAHQRFFFFGRVAPVGEVGRGGDAEQPFDPIGAAHRGVQRQPAAHRRSGENQWSLGQQVDRRQHFIQPAGQRSVGELAAGRSGAGIIEAQAAQSRASRKMHRLSSPWLPPCRMHSRAGTGRSAGLPWRSA